MKFLKLGIHFWITITSVLSFLTGWVMLAHAPKPAQSNSSATSVATPLPTLEPLNSLSTFGTTDENSSQSEPFFNVQPSPRSQFRPAFRTGGS
jgi:hypothetical protein